jgi:hypothetical protein
LSIEKSHLPLADGIFHGKRSITVRKTILNEILLRNMIYGIAV